MFTKNLFIFSDIKYIYSNFYFIFFFFIFFRSVYFYTCTAVSLFIIALINGILLTEKNEVYYNTPSYFFLFFIINTLFLRRENSNNPYI